MRLPGVMRPFVGYALVVAACLMPLRWVTPISVAGGSMRPVLVEGDVALVAKHVEPRAGAIALLTVPGHGPVLHRVLRHDERGLLVTMGDANERPDLRPVSPRHVAGKVVGVVPFGSLMERWRGIGACDTLTAQQNSARP